METYQRAVVNGSTFSCTSMARSTPRLNHEDYFNRKQNNSMNLQGVVDADGKFINVSTGWPDSIHDTRVLQLSTLYRRAENHLILNQSME